MPRTPTALPPQLGEIFTRAEAIALGVTDERLRRNDLERPFHGVYRRHQKQAHTGAALHPGEAWRMRQRSLARAFQASMPAHHFFCGRTALALHGVDVPLPASNDRDTLELGCLLPARATRWKGVRVRTMPPEAAEISRLTGLLVCGAATAWAHAAVNMRLNDRVSTGDSVLHLTRIANTDRLERPPHATLKELHAAADRLRGKERQLLMETLPLLSCHSASPPESHLRLRIRDWGLPDADLDVDIYSSNGRFLGCSEFAYPAYRIVIEYESKGHMNDERRWNRDLQKYRDYEREGWIVIRVTAELLYRRQAELRATIEAALRRRGWDG